MRWRGLEQHRLSTEILTGEVASIPAHWRTMTDASGRDPSLPRQSDSNLTSIITYNLYTIYLTSSDRLSTAMALRNPRLSGT